MAPPSSRPAVDAVLNQDQNVESIPENARRLLEEYSGMKPDEVIPSVVALVGLDVLKGESFPAETQNHRRETKPIKSTLILASVKCAF